MDLDEVDLAILELFDATGDAGVSPFQAMRLLHERIRAAYLIMSDLEDRLADDPMPSVSIH